MGPPPLPALSELTDRLGPTAVLTADAGLERYGVAARGPGGTAMAVVRPASTSEVRTTVRWARSHGVRLLPQGANTGLVGASTPPPDTGPPQQQDLVVLSTERLIGGLVIDPTDRSAVVPAGMRLSTLDAALSDHGLCFPIDLAADPSLGGMAATNTGGARMLRYGDVRRRVLGIEAVIADEDASVIDDLSILRKDNTGLNLAGLFVGSSGALGVITRVAIDLDRRPAERAALLLVPAGGEAAIRILSELEARVGDRLSAYEVMSSEAVAASLEVADLVTPFPAGPPELTALVELSGPLGVGEELLDAVESLAAADDVIDAIDLGSTRAWEVRHRCSEGLARRGTVVGFDIAVPRSALSRFRDDARRAVGAAFDRCTVADFGHWGDGGMHCNVVFPRDEPPDADERHQLAEIVFGLAVDVYSGSFSAEHGIGPHNAHWWMRRTPEGTRLISRRLKAMFDPMGVLGHPGLPY